uniref:Uncharacterized protein n=1 Tax=Setaria digitata TaxID=48799 RepID=A0A915PYF7_9BILA
MDEQLGDENLSSTLLKKQLKRIKEKEEIQNVVHETTETELSIPCPVPCSVEAHDSENANMEFWRLTAGKLASELDKIRKDNLNLENLINTAMTRLSELNDRNAELLEEAQYFDNESKCAKSTSSSSP